MTPALNRGRRPSPGVLEIIVGYFHRVAQPTYMGIVAGYVGWSLERTQEMFDELEDKKIIRPVTQEEKATWGYPTVANIYVLVEKPTPKKARW